VEESIALFVRRQIKQAIVIIVAYHFYKQDTIFFQHYLVKFTPCVGENYAGSLVWISS
jgi:hypothetical protein